MKLIKGIKTIFEKFASMKIETNKKVNITGVIGFILMVAGFSISNERIIIIGGTIIATGMVFREYGDKK